MQPLPGSLAYREEIFLLLRTFCIKRLRSGNLHVQNILLHAYTNELLQHFFLMLSWGMYKQEKYSLDILKESSASEHLLWRISYCIRAQISYMQPSPGSLTYKWPSVWRVIDLHQRSRRYSHQKRSTTCTCIHVYTCTCMHKCVYNLLNPRFSSFKDFNQKLQKDLQPDPFTSIWYQRPPSGDLQYQDLNQIMVRDLQYVSEILLSTVVHTWENLQYGGLWKQQFNRRKCVPLFVCGRYLFAVAL